MKVDAYLAGLLYGDGTSHHSKSNRAYQVWIDQAERNKYIAEEAKKYLEAIGLNVHFYGHQDKVRASVYSKEFFEFFRELRENVLDFFEALFRKEKLRFIAGFFDAEGTITDRYVFYNGNHGLLKAIVGFLKHEGVKSYIYSFGSIYGIQIYRKDDAKKFQSLIPSLKIVATPLVEKRS